MSPPLKTFPEDDSHFFLGTHWPFPAAPPSVIFPPLTDSEWDRRIDTNLMDSLRPPQRHLLFPQTGSPLLISPLVLSLSGQNVNLSSVTSLLHWHTTESVLIRKQGPITLLSRQKKVLFMWFIPAFLALRFSQSFPALYFKEVHCWPYPDLIDSFCFYFKHTQGIFSESISHYSLIWLFFFWLLHLWLRLRTAPLLWLADHSPLTLACWIKSIYSLAVQPWKLLKNCLLRRYCDNQFDLIVKSRPKSKWLISLQ